MGYQVHLAGLWRVRTMPSALAAAALAAALAATRPPSALAAARTAAAAAFPPWGMFRHGLGRPHQCASARLHPS